MADTTLVASDLPTGWTLGTQIRQSDDIGTLGDVWNGSAYTPYDSVDWATYATATPETPASSGAYVCQFPLTSPLGWYIWTGYKQVGGSPAATDPIAFQSSRAYFWDGSTFSDTAPVPVTASATGIAPALNGLAAVYCTDENIALRAWGDFVAICPPSQKLAAGGDGVVLPSDRWTLSSAAVDFAAAGVIPGCVVWLKLGNTFGSQGEIFAVNSVAGGTVTLRRMGQTASVGQPPAPAAGLTGIAFSVLTFSSQIDMASYDANHFFGIDPNSATKYPGRLYDQRELQGYVVLTVLKRAYGISLKQKAEDYALKLAEVTNELSDLTARLTIRWGADGKSEPATSIFSTRVRR